LRLAIFEWPFECPSIATKVPYLNGPTAERNPRGDSPVLGDCGFIGAKRARLERRLPHAIPCLQRERCHVGPKDASWPMHSVGTQLEKAAVGPTSGPIWRLSRLRVSRAAQAIPSRWSTIRCDKHKHEFDVQNVTWTSLGTRPSWGQAQRLGSPRIPTASTCACFESPPESHELRLGVLQK
jgi:hypothetical protein